MGITMESILSLSFYSSSQERGQEESGSAINIEEPIKLLTGGADTYAGADMTHPTPGLFECYVADIAAIIASFSEKDPAGKLALQQLLQSDPDTFRAAAISSIQHASGSPGYRYLLHLLMKEHLLAPAIADPYACSPNDALAAAVAVRKLGAPIDEELVRLLGVALRRGSSAPELLRILDLLNALDAGKEAQIYEIELTRHSDPRVRSKAALMIAHASKSATRVSRALLEGDPRVQANAVEGLWDLGANEYRSIFRMACTSPHNRVAGNGAVGLYKSGDVEAIVQIMELAERPDPAFRLTGIWAMGETADPRFLPYLKRVYETSSDPKLRFGAVRSMARIRRLEQELRNAGEITITPLRPPVTEGSQKRLEISLSVPGSPDASGLDALRFVLCHANVLVTDYSVESVPNPAILLAGFAAPRPTSTADPYDLAITSALSACLARKRSSDLWRIERFMQTGQSPAESDPNPGSGAIGDAAKSIRLRQRWGFLGEPDLIEQILQSPGMREKTAHTAADAVSRLADAMAHLAGDRCVFLFADPQFEQSIDAAKLAALKDTIISQHISVQGFAPENAGTFPALQDLCLSSERGSFETASVDALPDTVLRTYLNMFNRYQIVYSHPKDGADSPLDLKVYCSRGCGEITL
jgi:hypothetical protein